MKQPDRYASQRGQSLIIIAAGIVALVAMVAVVADAGNDYVQRRQLQNSLDAAASAGTLQLVVSGSRNGDVSDAVRNYASRNGTDANSVSAYYVVQDASGNNVVVRTGTIDTFGRNNPVPTTLSVGGSSFPVVGVQVEANRTFDTFFAGLLGFPALTVNGGSAAYANKGVCSSADLFPLGVNVTTFRDENGDGIRDVHTEQTDPTYTYQIFEKNAGQQNAPGNFGWLTWTAGDVSANTLASNLADNSRSGHWSVGDSIPSSTGMMNSSNVRTAVQDYINGSKAGTSVTIPVFDTVSGTGSNATYHIVGFARFRLTALDTTGNPKSITGKFQQWVDPTAEGGCASFGVASVKTRPPVSVTRSMVGTVKYQRLTLLGRVSQTTQHVPIDVVNVLDISGSMSNQFGSQTKIQAAKSALTSFNNNMQPTVGDQVGLVTFPLITSGTRYNYNCDRGGRTTSYYSAKVQNTLTGNISTVNSTINNLRANGYTPLAAGIQQGRQTVLGTNHRSGNVAILIIASDGLANARINGQITGFRGITFSSIACNAGAEQDALDQANMAKADSNGDGLPDVIIYTIAVGNDFNPALLQSIATRDTDPSRPHYFRATDAASMASIYAQIATQVQTIASECRIISTEAFAPNAALSVRNPDGTTQSVQTTSNGEFVLSNIQPGTYQVTAASVTVNGLTYNAPTDGVGGPDLTFPLSVVVGTGSGTYKTDFALKTTNSITCQ